MKRIGLTLCLALLLSLILTSCGRDGGDRHASDTQIRRLQNVIERQKATIRNLRQQIEEETGESDSGPCLAGMVEGGGVG